MVMNGELPSNKIGTVNGEKESVSSSTANKDDSNIPDIIEEKRKGIDGRITVNKYMKGRMLGKVCIQNRIIFIITFLHKYNRVVLPKYS